MAHVIKFSEAAFIALHGMVLVAKAKKGELINVVQISERLNSSKHHVAKVMQRMVKDGYLNSHRGPAGGFTLKMPVEDINLLDLYESIEGKIEIGDCPLDHPVCKFDKKEPPLNLQRRLFLLLRIINCPGFPDNRYLYLSGIRHFILDLFGKVIRDLG
jgi:Rrf2 family protein